MNAASPRKFDLNLFIADCRAALASDEQQKAMRLVVQHAISAPTAIMATFGEPRRAELQKLHVSPDLTILHLIWAPGMRFIPHNHSMWATIGIYHGQEDNVFWRRLDDPDAKGRIESAGAKSLVAGDVTTLGHDIIHSVTNPTSRFTGALHVYAGDFFSATRSEWDATTLTERAYSTANAIRAFDDANAALTATD